MSARAQRRTKPMFSKSKKVLDEAGSFVYSEPGESRWRVAGCVEGGEGGIQGRGTVESGRGRDSSGGTGRGTGRSRGERDCRRGEGEIQVGEQEEGQVGGRRDEREGFKCGER